MIYTWPVGSYTGVYTPALYARFAHLAWRDESEAGVGYIDLHTLPHTFQITHLTPAIRTGGQEYIPRLRLTPALRTWPGGMRAKRGS